MAPQKHTADKAIEAVFQREYQQVLAIAEKRIDARAYEIGEETMAKFPAADEGDEFEAFLAAHPDIAHAFLWTGKGHMEIQSQPDRMADPQLEEERRSLASVYGRWFDLESNDWKSTVSKPVDILKLIRCGGPALCNVAWRISVT
jgi:hypothetical protein